MIGYVYQKTHSHSSHTLHILQLLVKQKHSKNGGKNDPVEKARKAAFDHLETQDFKGRISCLFQDF